MNVFLNANSGLYECNHRTHLQPIKPPQTHFPNGPSKMCPQSINPSAHTSFSSLCSQNPTPSCSGNTSQSPVTQYNNALCRSFQTESISPATKFSEENIETQLFVE